MSDLDAIRARHYHITGPDSVCAEDRQPWPCDTAIVLVALDEASENFDTLSADYIASLKEGAATYQREMALDADVDAWYGAALMAADERDAAIEREARLRAALDTKPYEWLDEYAGGKGWEEAMTLMRAAFATTPEGE